MADIEVSVDARATFARGPVEDIVRAELAGVVALRDAILEGRVGLF